MPRFTVRLTAPARNQRGVALFAAIAGMVLLSTMIAALVILARNEGMIAQLNKDEAQAAYAEAFADHPDIVVPGVVAVGEQVLVTEWLDSPHSLAHVIREGTQEERDHYGELFVRFLFEGPRMTGMLHADPHPGNFRILPAPDGGLGRMGVLDFGAVARLEGGSMPPATGVPWGRVGGEKPPVEVASAVPSLWIVAP